MPGALAYTTSWVAQTSVTVTHNLGTTAVSVQVFDAAGNLVEPQGVQVTSVNTLVLTFGQAFTGSVVVIGVALPTPVGAPSGGPTNYSSAQVKLRILAQQNVNLVADLGGVLPSPQFRWFNRQLWPGEVAKQAANGTCVTCTQAGNIRQGNQSGIGNLEWPRLTLTVYDLDSETARSVANDVINFMETVDLCSNAQFGSPVMAPNQNPVSYLGQRDGMIPNPQSPSGPVYAVHTDFRVGNRADLSIN